jgi:hypothetical protein
MRNRDMAEEDNGGTEVNVEVEKNARHFGWVPLEEFRGNPDTWVDAETFEKRGKEINPILRSNNERLKKELQEATSKHDKEIAELRAAAEEFKTFQKESFEKKQKQLQDELQSLKVQRKEAMRENDVDLVEEIEDRMEAVKEEQSVKPVEKTPEPQKAAEIVLDPSLKSWMGDNEWFGVDVENTEIVNVLGAAVRRQFPNLTGKEFLDKLDERIEQRLPELRGNKSSQRESVDSSTTRGSSQTKKKSYENLPSDAKAACDKYVKQKLMTKEEYISMYDWS